MFASELGDIPNGWKSGKLEKFCTVFRGSSPRPISSPVFFENGNIPWIKIADATRSNSIYLSETREYCTEAALPYTRLLKKGSLILSNSATVGVPMILNLEGCIHDGWLSFKDYKVITRNFLFFVLVNKLSFLLQYADGSVQKNLNTGILNNMDFILPNLELITKFTDFSQSVFDKILSNENQIQTLTKTRDSLLPKLMSGQLRVKE
jgi:type I restriction enzyme S subunit